MSGFGSRDPSGIGVEAFGITWQTALTNAGIDAGIEGYNHRAQEIAVNAALITKSSVSDTRNSKSGNTTIRLSTVRL